MDNKVEETRKQVDNLFKETKKPGIFKEHDKLPPELKLVGENMAFEKKVEEDPVLPGVGKTRVFGCETWDINSILKGNYWRRSIYTTDKLCKLFLKADLNQKTKYLKKRNPSSINLFWVMIILFGVVIAIMVIMFLLPKFTGA